MDAIGEWVGALVGLTAPDSDEHLVQRVIGPEAIVTVREVLARAVAR